MNNINFVDRVKKYFAFLELEYGFKITSEINSSVRPQTDGAVEYSSNSMVIGIDSETGFATVRFYRLKDGDKYYLTPIDIYEYLNTTDREKALLLSTNPADRSLASALFNEKFLLNQPGWKDSHGTVEDLDNELRNFSDWLKAHSNLYLSSNSSWWLKFYEYKVNRARAEHLRNGKDELGYARIKDTNGNWQLVKQSIFKDKLEHVEKLKKEFSL